MEYQVSRINAASGNSHASIPLLPGDRVTYPAMERRIPQKPLGLGTETKAIERLLLATRLFFRVLRDQQLEQQIRALLDGPQIPASAREAVPTQPPATPARPAPAAVQPLPKSAAIPAASGSRRGDALTLLAVLQREARLVDFLKEPIAPYSDAQVGAAVRDVHRDAAAALDRLFGLQPVMSEEEGSPVQVSPGADAARIRLTGNVTGTPPFRGTLRHAGWEATKAQLPEWSGSVAASSVIAPAEVELQ